MEALWTKANGRMPHLLNGRRATTTPGPGGTEAEVVFLIPRKDWSRQIEAGLTVGLSGGEVETQEMSAAGEGEILWLFPAFRPCTPRLLSLPPSGQSMQEAS